MPVVPIVERQVESRAIGAPMRQGVSGFAAATSQRSQVMNPIIQGAGNLTNSYVDAAVKQREQADAVQVMNADRELNRWVNDYMFNQESGALNRKGRDAIPLPEEFDREYTKQYQALHSTLTPEQQRAFERAANARRMTANEQLQRYVFQQMGDYRRESVAAYQGQQVNNASLYFNDDKLVNDAAELSRNAVMITPEYQGASPERQTQLVQAAEGPVLYAALSQLVERDPRKAVEFYDNNRTRFGPDLLARAQGVMNTLRQTQEARGISNRIIASGNAVPANEQEMVSYVMDTLEGGGRLVNEPNGGVARYGINSVANPDVDVQNLTREGAAKLYVERYLPASNKALQGLSPDGTPVAVTPQQQLAAFDAVVNHGQGRGVELIAEAKGDPIKLLELREAEYRRLANANPDKYGSSLNGWINRLDTLRTQLDRANVDTSNPSQVLDYVNRVSSSPEVADLAFKSYTETLQQQENTRKLSRQQLSDDVARYTSVGATPPPELLERFRTQFPQDYIAWARNDKNADPAFVEEVRNAVLSGADVDLSQYRYQLGNEYDKLRELQTNPSERDKALAIEETIRRFAPAVIGRSVGPQTALEPEQAAKLDSYRTAVRREVQNRMAKSGQQPTSQEIEAIGALYSTDVTSWTAWTDGTFSQNMTDPAFTFSGVRMGDKFRVGSTGTDVTGREVVQSVAIMLQQRGEAVTPANIKGMIDVLKQRGELRGR